MLYYFSAVPAQLQEDIAPTSAFFLSPKDEAAAERYMWVSSAGVVLHTHFD
eukprot:CAMPEP_0175173522 /NCGR_PEP_ID=MMETSP0087-20121206/32101_1 /TAXON_ID=136419 /ORGANISM="Unknown Unknown, Strain D1" /LENGTH=50 /DNA_ID=CAMNT_0016464845 /DNA_START=1 /DNA_END=150 /DNA_ORIENTATION=-